MTEDGEMIYLDRVKDLRKLSTGYHFPPQYIETRLRFSPLYQGRHHPGGREQALCFLHDQHRLGNGRPAGGKKKRQIGFTTFADLSQNELVRQTIQQEVEKVNKNLDEGSRVKRFVNLPKELDPDEAELTRTRKIAPAALSSSGTPTSSKPFTPARTIWSPRSRSSTATAARVSSGTPRLSTIP